MSVKDLLQKARELIADPMDWCQGAAALIDHKTGRIQHCLSQAILQTAGSRRGEDCIQAVDRVIDQCKGLTIPAFNDTHSHAEVLEALDRAIAATPD